MGEPLFTCSKCSCHIFIGPLKFDSDNPVVICPNCYKTVRCTNELLNIIKENPNKKHQFKFNSNLVNADKKHYLVDRIQGKIKTE